MDRKEAIELFRRHWKYLGDTCGDDVDKEIWVENIVKENLIDFVDGVKNSCFLCQWVVDEYYDFSCELCPIKIEPNCYDPKSLFGRWYLCEDKKFRGELAEVISKLPERNKE